MTPDSGRAASTPSAGETVLYCRACRRALNTRTTESGHVSYRHAIELRGQASDHPADPVPLTELPDPVMECDFCSQPGPVWAYVCDDQHTEIRVVTARVVGAADYQRRHRAARTLRTETAPGFTQAMPAKYTRGKHLVRVRGELHATYTNLFATLIPGRGRITPGNPLGVWPPPDSAT